MQSFSREAPSVEINPQALTQSIRAAGELGQAMAGLGEKIYKLNAQEELQRANTQAKEGRLAIENTEDRETNGWLQRREKEMKDLRANTLKGLRNPLARNAFEADFDNEILDTQFRLKKAYTSLSVNNVKETLYQEQEAASSEILAGLTPEREQARISKIGARYSQLAQMGGVTPIQALEGFKTWQEDLRVKKLDTFQYGNPAGFLAAAKAGQIQFKGEKEEAERINKAQGLVKNQEDNQKALKEIDKTRGMLDLGTALVNRTLTPELIRDTLALENISPEDAAIFEKAITVNMSVAKLKKDKKSDPAKVQLYLDLVDEALDEGQDISGTVHSAVKAYTEKAMNAPELQFFIQELNKKLERRTKEQNPDKATLMLKNAVNTIKQWSGAFVKSASPLEITRNMIGELFSQVQAGKNPEEAVREIIRDEAKNQNPSVLALDDIPSAVMNKSNVSETGVLQSTLKPDVEVGGQVKDSFGFVIGEERNGYTYIGDNKWRKK